MIQIIDYGLGNTGSIFNILKKIGIQSEIINDQIIKVPIYFLIY